MKKMAILMAIILMFFSLQANAKTKFSNFLSHLEKVKTLEISFVQITEYDPELEEKDIYKGKIEYKRPAKFKWSYTKNSKIEIVSDGKTVWTCIPENNKLEKTSTEESMDYFPIIRILEYPQEFSKYFMLVSDAKFKDKIAYEITPKRKNVTYEKIIIIFKEDKPYPVSFQVINEDGSTITYIIEKWQENVKLPDTIFTINRCKVEAK
ncbi:LolA family protein [Desulfurobacterium atlanticum]|uniref:Chaperone LolA n=1 Tax=Desulfurobacterium atlanticum TaxID=240169 RepID=A0A238Z541_9BACT|nr:outer membrane lipoprotein carrier protein LolA [Desulfurobacterium atlanticum]SNR78051.1 chaperone LolA [Desulfurobacterium atlanticum]